MVVQFAPEPGPEPGMPSRTVVGTATVRNAAGTVVGSMDYVNCYFVPGLSASLGGVENANGSGVTSLTYAATGAQKIASTTVDGFFASASPIISAPGATPLTAWSRDQAGLRSTNLVTTFVITSSISCGGIAPGVALPKHGTLEVSGTVTDGPTAQPFQQSISF
jgi:hypothetical protein